MLPSVICSSRIGSVLVVIEGAELSPLTGHRTPRPVGHLNKGGASAGDALAGWASASSG